MMNRICKIILIVLAIFLIPIGYYDLKTLKHKTETTFFIPDLQRIQATTGVRFPAGVRLLHSWWILPFKDSTMYVQVEMKRRDWDEFLRCCSAKMAIGNGDALVRAEDAVRGSEGTGELKWWKPLSAKKRIGGSVLDDHWTIMIADLDRKDSVILYMRWKEM